MANLRGLGTEIWVLIALFVLFLACASCEQEVRRSHLLCYLKSQIGTFSARCCGSLPMELTSQHWIWSTTLPILPIAGPHPVKFLGLSKCPHPPFSFFVFKVSLSPFELVGQLDVAQKMRVNWTCFFTSLFSVVTYQDAGANGDFWPYFSFISKAWVSHL